MSLPHRPAPWADPAVAARLPWVEPSHARAVATLAAHLAGEGPVDPAAAPRLVELAHRVLAVSGAAPWRDELVAGLSVGVDALGPDWPADVVLERLDAVGHGALVAAVRRWRRRTRGLIGAVGRGLRRLDNGLRDVPPLLRYAASGAPGHEGGYDGRRWRSWNGEIEARPRRWEEPEHEAALAALVAEGEPLRIVGSGHSFNDAAVSEARMVSLDRMAAVLDVDPARRVARVQAGARLRDVNLRLAEHGLALPLLGSTDAQSLGGLIATDLHGTGRDRGFLSEQVRGLRVLDAAGRAHERTPGQDAFHAVFGGLGAAGIVTEVELQLVDAFQLAKGKQMVDRAACEAEIEALWARHEHLSFYYVSGGARCQAVQLHTWDRVDAPPDPGWARVRAQDELSDFAISALAHRAGQAFVAMPSRSRVTQAVLPARRVVMPSHFAFGRRLFYRHDEIELGLPFEAWTAAVEAILSMMARRGLFSILEVRFTPDTSRSLIGPGAGRRTAWVELATPLSLEHREAFVEAEAILLDHGGRPHPGKKTMCTAEDLRARHGERFERFDRVRREVDPEGRLLNPLARRLFVPSGA